MTTIRHPAKYTDVLLPVFAELLALETGSRILDPFAGTGKIFSLLPLLPDRTEIEAVEIEPEWAGLDSRITLVRIARRGKQSG